MLATIRGLGAGLFRDSQETPRAAPAGGTRLDLLTARRRVHLEDYLLGPGEIAVIALELENFQVFRDIYGGHAAQCIQEAALSELQELAVELLPGCDIRSIQELEPGRFAIFCGQAGWEKKYLAELALNFRLMLRARVKNEALNLTGQSLGVSVGYSTFSAMEGGLENTVYQAVSDARKVAAGTLDVTKLNLLGNFRDIVSSGRLKMAFQPIVSLSNGEIAAWEGLTRGPKGSHFASPAVLFDFAEEMDQIFFLEKACRENAISGIGRMDSNQKLFMNVHPKTLVDPEFSPGETSRLLGEHGISPSSVVLEITERHSIRDFSLFHRTLEHYRRQGFQVAIDDVGTGYSGLWSIAQIRPEYLKVDMSLVRGVDTDPVKRALMETLVTFSGNIGCGLIAEGIEDEAELSTLMRMGVEYGQGFFLSRPAYPKPGLCPEVRQFFSGGGMEIAGDRKCSAPVRDLVQPVTTVDPDTTVGEVRELFADGSPISSAVVAQGGRPLGLVMSHHMDHILASQYGMSLYANRPVSLIMDPSPLYGEALTPVENVAREAMKRQKSKVFDHIVVTEKGQLLGVASVQDILDAMASVQVEMAKGANPLSGLPGNVAIDLELERRARSGEAFSIVYADLDNFKAYNDSYGFKNGDKVILLIARIMSWAVRKYGSEGGSFVGHVGGDDLVAICSPERSERVCLAVIRCFKRLVKNCYMPKDRKRGCVEGLTREGETCRFPLVSVSLAIVDCDSTTDQSLISHRAAEMKKYAKSISGNSWVRDRRGFGADDEGEGVQLSA